MTVGELREMIRGLPEDMRVQVPSCYDGDYDVDAKAEICEFADGSKYLQIFEA